MSTKDGIRIPNWMILVLVGVLVGIGLCCLMSGDVQIWSEPPVVEGPDV